MDKNQQTLTRLLKTRLGLPIYQKEFLQQFFEYLDGLYSFYVEESDEKAFEKIYSALSRPKTLYHTVGKYMLTLLMSILTRRFAKQRFKAKQENLIAMEKIDRIADNSKLKMNKGVSRSQALSKKPRAS